MSKTSIEWLPGPRLHHCRTSGETMGTRYAARFYASPGVDLQAVVAGLRAAITTVDAQMSNWKPGSDLARVNRADPGAWTAVPPPLARVLARALEIGRETGNAFDIGVGDLVDAWGFGPSRARRDDGLPAAGPPRTPAGSLLEVDVAGCRVRKHGPVSLDLCGIAKGFGVDELGRVLDEQGIGAWLVGIDGEMRARGTKPDGSGWAIAIESPEADRRAAMGVIELADAAVATSGDYRHVAHVGGRRISHTMDPRTGAPLCSALASVTVIAPRCMDADAYATALMVLGEDAGKACAQRLGLDACFVARDAGGLRPTGTGCFEGGHGRPAERDRNAGGAAPRF